MLTLLLAYIVTALLAAHWIHLALSFSVFPRITLSVPSTALQAYLLALAALPPAACLAAWASRTSSASTCRRRTRPLRRPCATGSTCATWMATDSFPQLVRHAHGKPLHVRLLALDRQMYFIFCDAVNVPRVVALLFSLSNEFVSLTPHLLLPCSV